MVSQNSIKLISLNIERDLHYGRVFSFLRKESADVVCLQEVIDKDMSLFQKELGMFGFHVPIALADRGRHTEGLAKIGVNIGTALFSSLHLEDNGVFYYSGTPDKIPSMKDQVPAGRHENSNGVFLWARVSTGLTKFTIGTTHFSWSPDGLPSEGQRRNMAKLLEGLHKFPDIVFCGDFNAPRGREIWNMLASRYKDNIPAEYKTSIDQVLHKFPGIQYVVDGLFTTPEYRCVGTRLECGVSDHCAIVSTIEKIA